MRNSKLGKWILVFTAGVILAALISLARGLLTAQTMTERMLCLCDGFSVSGALFLCVAVMFLIAGEGAFDMLGYAVQKGLHHFVPGRFQENIGNYYDYRCSKQGREKKRQTAMLLTGVILLGIGLIFMLIWHFMENSLP